MVWAHSPSFGLWGIYYDDSGAQGPADSMVEGTDQISAPSVKQEWRGMVPGAVM